MNTMKNTILIVSLFSLVAVGCTGGKSTGKTTPGTDPKASDNTGKVDPSAVKDAAPTGPASDLCTDTQCPGVVR